MPIVTWYREIWFLGGIPKPKFLTWFMVFNRSPKIDRLLQWGLQTDPSCLLCNSFLESRAHLFSKCRFSWTIWKILSKRCNFNSLRNWESLFGQLRNYKAPKRLGRNGSIYLIAWQPPSIWSGLNAVTAASIETDPYQWTQLSKKLIFGFEIILQVFGGKI